MKRSIYMSVIEELILSLPSASSEAFGVSVKTNISSHMYWTVYTKLIGSFNKSFYMPVVNKMTNSLNNAFGGGRTFR
jgi:hypothetical protein